MIIFKKTFLFLFFIISNLLFPQQKNNKLFDEAIKTKSDQFIDEVNFSKTQSFFLQKEWDSTLIYSIKQLNRPFKNSELKNYCHFFRGYSFYKKKIFKEAKKEFAEISPEFSFYSRIDMYLGEIAMEEDEFKKAIYYFEKIKKSRDYGVIGVKMSSIDNNLGVCYLHLKEYDKATFYMNNIVKTAEIKKDTIAIISSYINVANLYYNQYKDDLAIPYFKNAYRLSKEINDFESKLKASKNMAMVEEYKKNLVKALEYRKEYDQWKDSLNNQNSILKVAQFEKEFAVKEKQKEVTVLEAENKTKIAERNGFLYSAIFLLVLLGTGFYFYREKIKANKIIITQKESLDELNTTKDKLFSIVSHDLRSSVNALKRSNTELSNNLEAKNLKQVSSLLHKNSNIVNGAYNLLDNILNWALLQTKQSYFKMEVMPLFILVEHVAHNYIPLMEDKAIIFKNEVDNSVMVYVDQESLKIVLRNLLDNAIKFTNPNGSLIIYTEETDLYYKLILEDTGIGISETKREELLKETLLLSKKEHENITGTGLGMQLCKSMIKKNKGLFFIESELGIGTKMIVSLLKTQPNGEH